MSGGELVSALLLVFATAALGASALRLAALVVPGGLALAVGAAPMFAALAVGEAIVLGWFGLGGTEVVLALAAAATWAGVRLATPAASGTVGAIGAELTRWWWRQSPPARVLLAAIGGLALALVALLWRRPQFGFDGATYHVPEVVGFVQSGHPGRALQSYYGLPVGNYPLTEEVLLGWVTGLSRGFPAMLAGAPLSALLLVGAMWLGLRELAVSRVLRVLGIAAVMLAPLVVASWSEVNTDVPALAWLVCCAALCLGSRRRVSLLIPAIVAYGLGVGTKTTVAPWGTVILLAALWNARRRVRTVSPGIVLAVTAAILTGGIWYLRNAVAHGSPLWPFYAAPWGDPVPPLLHALSRTLLERPRVTLFDHLHDYATALYGAAGLVVLGPIVALCAGRRRTRLAAVVSLVGLIVWAGGPATGVPDIPGVPWGPVAGSALRYLMPTCVAAAVALVLAGVGGGRWVAASARTVLVAVCAWDLVGDLRAQMFVRGEAWLAVGIALGALAGALSPALRTILTPRLAAPARRASLRIGAAALAGLACALVLGAVAHDFVAREARGPDPGATAAAFLIAQPGFAHDRTPVASTGTGLGMLAGDRLQHPLSLLPPRTTCRQARARARAGWVVVQVVHPVAVPGQPGLSVPVEGTAQSCLATLTPRFDDGALRIYGAAAGAGG